MSITRFVTSATALFAFGSCLGWAQFDPPKQPYQTPTPDPMRVEWIVARVKSVQSQTGALTSYQVLRTYRVFPTNRQEKVWEVVAEINFVPPNHKTYTIKRSSGYSRVDAAVTQILDKEVEASAQGRQLPTAALLEGNYKTTYLGEAQIEGHRCYELGLIPTRIDKNLIAGRAWVDEDKFLVRQVEGDMVRSPSWWVKKVHVKFVFGNFSGNWLQTSSKSIADIRIFGSHTMVSETSSPQNAAVANGPSASGNKY